MTKDLDQTTKEYFDSIENSTKEHQRHVKSTSELSDAFDEDTNIALEAGIALDDLRNSSEMFNAALAQAKEEVKQDNQRRREWIKEQMDEVSPLVRYSQEMPGEAIPVKIVSDETETNLPEKEEKDKPSDSEERKDEKKNGFFKRIKTNLEKNAKEGEGVAKTFGAKALLGVGSTLNTIKDSILSSIPGYQQASSAIKTTKAVRSEMKEARERKRKSKEEKAGESEETKSPVEQIPLFGPEAESKTKDQLDKSKEKKKERKSRQDDKRQDRLLKETKKGNKLLNILSKRMIFGTLMKLLAPLAGIGGIITAAMTGVFDKLGLVRVLSGLKSTLGLVKSALTGMTDKLKSMFPGSTSSNEATTADKDKNKNKRKGQRTGASTAEEARRTKTAERQTTKKPSKSSRGLRKTFTKLGGKAIPIAGAVYSVFDFLDHIANDPENIERAEKRTNSMIEFYKKQAESHGVEVERNDSSTEREIKDSKSQTKLESANESNTSAMIRHYQRQRESLQSTRESATSRTTTVSPQQAPGNISSNSMNNQNVSVSNEYRTIMVQPNYQDNANRAAQGAR